MIWNVRPILSHNGMMTKHGIILCNRKTFHNLATYKACYQILRQPDLSVCVCVFVVYTSQKMCVTLLDPHMCEERQQKNEYLHKVKASPFSSERNLPNTIFIGKKWYTYIFYLSVVTFFHGCVDVCDESFY